MTGADNPRSWSRPIQPTPPTMGCFRASDIVNLRIQADLAMLSACATAPSGEDGRDGRGDVSIKLLRVVT
jgi:CHAT domain-containing protein